MFSFKIIHKDKKSKALEGVTITIKKKTFTQTTTTDSEGNYSITDLESGKYTLTAKIKGYQSFKKSIKLASGQDKTLNIKLKKKK